MGSLLALLLVASAPLTAASGHLKAGQLDDLVFDLADSVTLAPAEMPEAARLLAQGAILAQQKADPVLALQLAQTAHRRDPKQLDALRVLTELSLRDQSFTEADGYADTLGNLAPRDAHVTLLRARVAAAEEDWGHADALSAVLRGDPSLSPAEQKEAQAIHQQAAPFVAQRQAADRQATVQEEKLHAAAERASQLRAEAFNGDRTEPGHSGSSSVVVYGTSWCGFCKQARAYLQQRHIEFEDKDVELDADAAAEMRSKAQAAGFRGGGVPVIDVYGKILQGFSRAAVDQALKRGGG